MFIPITIEKFVQSYKKNNPGKRNTNIRQALLDAVEAKENGATCTCGEPIWAIGSAVTGWSACFLCTTGEADSSEDYEIESVCF